MSYFETMLTIDPTLKLKNGFVQKKSKSIICYYSKKLVKHEKDQIPWLPLELLYLLSLKVILYTFLVSQYSQISKQTKQLTSEDWETIQVTRFPFQIHPKIWKQRSFGVLIVVFLINDLRLIIQFLRVISVPNQFQYRVIALKLVLYLTFGMGLAIQLFRFFPNLRMDHVRKLFQALRKYFRYYCLLPILILSWNFLPFFSRLETKIEPTKTPNLHITRIVRKMKLDSIALQGSLQLKLTNSNETTDSTIPNNPVVSHRSEPGKLTCYKTNGEIVMVGRFRNTKFSRREIKRIIDGINARQKKKETNQGKTTNQRIQYFSKFIQKEKQSQELPTLNDNPSRVTLTIDFHNFSIKFRFQKD